MEFKTSISNNTKSSRSGSWSALLKRVSAMAGVVAMLLLSTGAYAQPDATAAARMDARQIVVGDQVRLFLEVKNKPSLGRVEWITIPDTFNHLEVVEKGKIDTIKGADYITYKQRLILTGFDSGVFKVPSFIFPVFNTAGDPFTIQTDSFMLAVQTVAVDTTREFKPIKGVMTVETDWRDYIWYIVGGVLLLALIIGVIIYFVRKPKPAPVVPEGPKETLQEHTLRLLNELEKKQLWQNQKVKEYYVELTDIVRNYIEARFNTPALELTTDELLYKAQMHRDLQPHHAHLSVILTTADLAKFAKAQPMPQEHTTVMSKAIELVVNSKPVIVATPTEPKV
jgi:hypothetical protein